MGYLGQAANSTGKVVHQRLQRFDEEERRPADQILYNAQHARDSQKKKQRKIKVIQDRQHK